jgi:hypothetical protein
MKKSGLADSPLFKRPVENSLGEVGKIATNSEGNPNANSERHTITPVNFHPVTPSHQDTSVKSPQHTPSSIRKRAKKKHGFLIYRDQLRALKEIQLAVWRRDEIEPDIGQLVREALDEFVEKMRKKLEIEK